MATSGDSLHTKLLSVSELAVRWFKKNISSDCWCVPDENMATILNTSVNLLTLVNGLSQRIGPEMDVNRT